MLTKSLQVDLESYCVSKNAFDQIAAKYFDKVGSQAQSVYKNRMDEAAKSLSNLVTKIVESPDYQEAVHHKKFNLDKSNQSITEIQEKMKLGRLTITDMYTVASNINCQVERLNIKLSNAQNQKTARKI